MTHNGSSDDAIPVDHVIDAISQQIFSLAQKYEGEIGEDGLRRAEKAYGLGPEAMVLAMAHATTAADLINERAGGDLTDRERSLVIESAHKGFMYAYAWLFTGNPPPVLYNHYRNLVDEGPRPPEIILP